MARSRPAPLTIGPVRTLGPRVSAEVDDIEVWFESHDRTLAPAPEAFASAFLIPALLEGARITVADPLDPMWLDHATEIGGLLGSWWRTAPPQLEAPRALAGAPPAAATPSTALFFSAGVDSFHELLRGGHDVDHLVTLLGFDFPLDDGVRAAAVDASVRAVAAACGARTTTVATNVRTHPRIAGIRWERAYGGVLGGVAQLLAPASPRVVIAASAPSDRETPWGSHWQLDPLWSSSAALVVHGGRGLRRVDKLRAIAAEPIVQDHLRVCWQNRAPTGNCSTCAKCVLARLVLADCGVLAASRVFEGPETLARRIDGVRKTPDRIREFDELSRSPRLDPAVTAAATRLVRRSRHRQRPDVRLRRAMIRWVLKRFGPRA